MNIDISKELQSCAVCNATRPHQLKEPLQLHPVPALPWSTVATDLFEWQGQPYSVLVDSYSGWFEIDRLRDISSATVIKKLKRHFSVHGAPHTLISDNGRQYTSQRFKEFATQWDFVHVTSSPEYPQSNGLAERAVRSAKQLMEKSHRDGSDVFLNLLNIRNIPRDSTLGSSAERLMSRQTRSTFPVDTKLLAPASKNSVQIASQLQNKRLIQKQYYDANSRPLIPLAEGQVVRLQTTKGHDRIGTVKGVCKEPRSYIIESNGGVYRRNRRHILPVAEPRPRHFDPAVVDPPDLAPPSPQIRQVPRPSQPIQQFAGVHLKAHSSTGEPQGVNAYVTRSGRICKPNPKYCD
ncbi:unnamed protein product [Knipowitschia caucasica]